MDDLKKGETKISSGQSIEIKLADGSAPQSSSSVLSWERGLPANKKPVTADELMEERHHGYYGRPWILGRYYFDQLIKFGLGRSDVVLDLGCGAGRVGIHLIPFLESGNYCGVDYHLRSLIAFGTYEALMYDLARRQPSLLWDAEFKVGFFGKKFDAVLDFYVTHHLDLNLVRIAYQNVAEVTRPGARVFLAHEPTIGLKGMLTLGFELQERQEISYPLISMSEKPIQKVDAWHVFRRV